MLKCELNADVKIQLFMQDEELISELHMCVWVGVRECVGNWVCVCTVCAVYVQCVRASVSA